MIRWNGFLLGELWTAWAFRQVEWNWWLIASLPQSLLFVWIGVWLVKWFPLEGCVRGALYLHIYFYYVRRRSLLLIVMEKLRKNYWRWNALTHLFFADDSFLFTRARPSDCNALLNILQIYEEASSQKLNFDKSSIRFSLNDGKRRYIARRLGHQGKGLSRCVFQSPYNGRPELKESLCGNKRSSLEKSIGACFRGMGERFWWRLCFKQYPVM